MEINIESKEIKMVKVEDLIEYPKNRHIHTEQQIDRLCELIKYNNFRNPLIADVKTNWIIAGNGRFRAAKKMGMKEVPVIFQEFTSDEQMYAYMVSDNAIGKDEWATLDMAGINADLGDLGPDFNLDFLGLKDFTLDLSEKLEPGCDEDEAPEPPKESKVVLGDLFELGEHRLLCGDSTNIQHVERLMNGEKIDLVFTDPPYNANIKGIKNDHFENTEDFIEFMNKWYSIAHLQLKDSACIYVWCFWKTMCEIKVGVFNKYKDLDLKNILIWSKPSLKASSNYYKRSYEACLFYAKGNYKFYPQNADTVRKSTQEKWGASADSKGWYDPKGNGKKSNINFHTATDIWEDVPTMGRGGNKEYLNEHPTQKPLKACERSINASSDINDNILDLFGGSGSTLIACEKSNRKCFMQELDPHYVSVILDRWEKFSNKKAYRINEDGSKTLWQDIKNMP